MTGNILSPTKIWDPIPLNTIIVPPINVGEQYIGSIITRLKSQHVILLSGEISDCDWNIASEWAKSIGGILPSPLHAAFLAEEVPYQFKPAWYWTSGKNPTYPTHAMLQYFGDASYHCFERVDAKHGKFARAIRVVDANVEVQP